MKKFVALTAATLLTSTTLVACGGAGGGETTKNADGEIVVDFWHSASGAAATTLEEIVSDFNAEHEGEIEVNASYQGSYEDSISKFIASVQTGELPAMLQASDVQTAYLRDSGVITPAQEITDDYDYDNLVDAVKNYYQFEDKVYSMPFMVSQPAIYTNDDELEQAGVNPDDLKTVEGLLNAAEKIHEKTGHAGLTFHHSGWYMEEFQSSMGNYLCSPENGVSEKATEFNLESEDNVALWERIGELYAKGAIHNPGKDGSAATGAFLSNEATIQLNSSGNYGNIQSGNPNFKWSIRSLPRDTDEAGAVPGGNSLWSIKEGHSEETQEAVAEFMKYAGSDDVQKKIFDETGYLPTTTGAGDTLEGLEPQQEALIEQLTSTPENKVTAGCKTGALNAARKSYESAMSSIANGSDAKTALTEAQQGANNEISSYNERAGK
ncbi:extracellular solute-binding protein [Corynebacterium sp. p3-SID1194]|uniref:extracellular solute-binding protein n=1 Tax=Corynebacterium sp. p3-SID1194 TaxID=2916105 RepID=UPI0021A888DA|nr:extracellular solute-binding protein [Corynebacterium sp. p3-SID1194]MCT1449602.1 extracellular solute-binding protein [Corynebacterium sp. p3-SID1194]